jgi:hypothetical protein
MYETIEYHAIAFGAICFLSRALAAAGTNSPGTESGDEFYAAGNSDDLRHESQYDAASHSPAGFGRPDCDERERFTDCGGLPGRNPYRKLLTGNVRASAHHHQIRRADPVIS